MSEITRFFPFSAIVGQEKLKSAYLANLVHPRIGGLLISGPKGTGKSTLVHSIRSLLPEIEAVEGCPFHCDPSSPATHCSRCASREDRRVARRRMQIVNLPLSCTEDRLVGSINVEKLLSEGRREVEPGILGQANRNILYVDEVNLLPDHLVDDILDAAARHWNTIEREGVSFSHPAEFVLVGSMNPEEGELRPQILDRFPLCVRMESIRDPGRRVEIIRRNLLFESDPGALVAMFEAEDAELKRKLLQARGRAALVPVEEACLLAVASACAELKVDGQRPDIVIVKTAQALAALEGRTRISREDVRLSAELALNHRTRDGGLLDPPTVEEIAAVFRKEMDSAGMPAAAGRIPEREGEGARNLLLRPGAQADSDPRGDGRGAIGGGPAARNVADPGATATGGRPAGSREGAARGGKGGDGAAAVLRGDAKARNEAAKKE